MIKKGNSNNASRVLIGDREVSKVYKGSNLVWQKLPDEGIPSSLSVAGDICLYNKSTDKLLIVHRDDISAEAYPSANYSSVGVVVVPGTHNVYGNGQCAIVSLKLMNCHIPETGGLQEYDMASHSYYSAYTPAMEYNIIPYVAIGPELGDVSSTIIGSDDIWHNVYFSSDAFKGNGTQCIHNNNTYYYAPYGLDDGDTLGPSPYLTDGSRNPAYYQTTPPSSTLNALSDFDGRGNTDLLLKARGDRDYSSWKPTYNDLEDFPAASCCDMYHTDGTKQGDWYFPALGELVYLLPTLKKINDSIGKLRAVYGEIGVEFGVNKQSTAPGGYYLSASTPESKGTLYDIDTGTGAISDGSSTTDAAWSVRAFLRVKI